jgi:hypothetical protein
MWLQKTRRKKKRSGYFHPVAATKKEEKKHATLNKIRRRHITHEIASNRFNSVFFPSSPWISKFADAKCYQVSLIRIRARLGRTDVFCRVG